MPESPFPVLTDTQVAFQRLLNLLQVKQGVGFSLSSALVPIVDVTSLLQEETGASLEPLTGADIWTDRLGGPFIEAAFGLTYTVPIGRSAIVEAIHGTIRRTGAAATPGEANIFAVVDRVQPRVGHSTPFVFRLSLGEPLNAVGNFVELHLATRIFLRAGDAIRARNADTSIGGTTYMEWGAIILERAA